MICASTQVAEKRVSEVCLFFQGPLQPGIISTCMCIQLEHICVCIATEVMVWSVSMINDLPLHPGNREVSSANCKQFEGLDDSCQYISFK